MNKVDLYIAGFPPGVQELLQQLRSVIRETAPEAEEGISYGIPAYRTNGRPLVYFAGYKNHIGFYALPTGHSMFAQELSEYKQGKGSVQFPVDEPLPADLIRRIVVFRIKENETKK